MLSKTLVLGVICLFIGVGVQSAIATEVYQDFSNKSGEFISLKIVDINMQVRKHSLKHIGTSTKIKGVPQYLDFDADLDELKIELVVNYTAEMNYTFPFFAPIYILGLKVENYTRFKWEYFKLKNYGIHSRSGNFSVGFNIDMTEIESGDELIIETTFSYHTIPSLLIDYDNDTYNESLYRLIRLVYHMPLLNEFLLSNWLFPKIATYEHFHFTFETLYLFFY
jgi:hypothetical protein